MARTRAEIDRVLKSFATDVLLAVSCREAVARCVLVGTHGPFATPVDTPFDYIETWPRGLLPSTRAG